MFVGDNVQQGSGRASLQGTKPYHRRPEGKCEPGNPRSQATGQSDRSVLHNALCTQYFMIHTARCTVYGILQDPHCTLPNSNCTHCIAHYIHFMNNRFSRADKQGTPVHSAVLLSHYTVWFREM